MNRNWRWFLPCYLFLAVNALIAFTYAIVWCRARSWEWRDGVFTFVSDRMAFSPGAQGWSWIVGYATEEDRNDPGLRVHENCHVVQEFACSFVGLATTPAVFALVGWSPVLGLALGGPVGGLLFIMAYLGTFLYHFIRTPADPTRPWAPRWWLAYMQIPFEKQAYAIQDEFEDGSLPKAWGA